MSDGWVRIGNGRLTAAINPLGAELSSLTDADGRELMTDADPAFWGGHAPILFPVVGKPNGETIRVDGRSYPMRQHGFARRRMFALAERGDDRVSFTLAADDETRAVYPFDFVLRVAFAIVGATLSVAVTVENPDPVRALPASIGFHPTFAWPLPYGAARAAHRIVFEQQEGEAIRRIVTGEGTIAPEPRPSPLDGRVLHLADDLFTADALIWDAVRSQSVLYGADSGPQLRIDFPDTPMLGIWTQPGAHFVCIEPWHGIADPQGYTGEFADKPGVFTVAPGASRTVSMAVTLIG